MFTLLIHQWSITANWFFPFSLGSLFCVLYFVHMCLSVLCECMQLFPNASISSVLFARMFYRKQFKCWVQLCLCCCLYDVSTALRILMGCLFNACQLLFLQTESCFRWCCKLHHLKKMETLYFTYEWKSYCCFR